MVGGGTAAAGMAMYTKISTSSCCVRTRDALLRSEFFLERNLKQLEFEEEITAHKFVIAIE